MLNRMQFPSPILLCLVAIGGALMFHVVINAISRTAVVAASDEISIRRSQEAKRRAEDAAAVAAGRAAGLEPLALNSDGSIMEPIIGEVEKRG